jgi:hypothetical protein
VSSRKEPLELDTGSTQPTNQLKVNQMTFKRDSNNEIKIDYSTGVTRSRDGEEFISLYLTYLAMKDAGTRKAKEFIREAVKKGMEVARLERMAGNTQRFDEYALFYLGLTSAMTDAFATQPTKEIEIEMEE